MSSLNTHNTNEHNGENQQLTTSTTTPAPTATSTSTIEGDEKLKLSEQMNSTNETLSTENNNNLSKPPSTTIHPPPPTSTTARTTTTTGVKRSHDDFQLRKHFVPPVNPQVQTITGDVNKSKTLIADKGDTRNATSFTRSTKPPTSSSTTIAAQPRTTLPIHSSSTTASTSIAGIKNDPRERFSHFKRW
jgi:hypothetical protein